MSIDVTIMNPRATSVYVSDSFVAVRTSTEAGHAEIYVTTQNQARLLCQALGVRSDPRGWGFYVSFGPNKPKLRGPRALEWTLDGLEEVA